jgi:hypothetical protein
MYQYTREMAEAFKSRQGKYPFGYDPGAQAPEEDNCEDQDIDDEWASHRNEKAAAALQPIDPADYMLEPEDGCQQNEEEPREPPEEESSATDSAQQVESVASESVDDNFRDLDEDFSVPSPEKAPAKPDPAEEIAEAVRTAKAREKIAEGVKAAKAEKKRRMKAGMAAKRDTKGHSIKETFRGAFGSAAILTSTTISPIDKLILQLVDSFATGKEKKSGRFTGPCTAANECIAMYLGQEANYINKRLSVLQREGLIITLGLKRLYTRRVVSPHLSKDRAITEMFIAKYAEFTKR